MRTGLAKDLELIRGAAQNEGGAVVLLWSEQDTVELGYVGELEPSWMGLTWSHQRILARADVGYPFKLVFATLDSIHLLHRSGIEVHIRFG